MKPPKVNYLLRKFKDHLVIYTLLSNIILIVLIYFIIFQIPNHHLAFTHLVYIPVVITASLLGAYYGLVIGIVAGISVGPLIPFNLVTGEAQSTLNWLVRLIMIAFVGFLVGYLSENYKKINDRQKADRLLNSDSGIHNLSYLRLLKFDSQTVYTLMSFTIYNHESIRDVLGFETYYTYLKNIKIAVLEKYPEIDIIQPTNHSLWFIKEKGNVDDDIHSILNIIDQHSKIDGDPIFVDYTLGIATKKFIHETNIIDSFIPADLAAKEAKSKLLKYFIYTDIRTKKQFEFEILSDFHQALYNGDIYLVYQPKVNLTTKKPIGIEALIRWNHPTKKMINPDEFIPSVETSSMIHEMTHEVFKWALTFAKKAHKVNPKLEISINISTKNLYDDLFYEKMVTIFKNFDMNPRLVELELTESVLMEDPELSKSTLEKFSKFGFKIAIDDFGKGYSSLAYLAQFPINTIKIDRFFSKQILVNPTSQHIVKATIELAKQLGYEVLIEGIEDIETANLLERLGCHSAQGYLFMRPRREEEILEYLNKQH